MILAGPGRRVSASEVRPVRRAFHPVWGCSLLPPCVDNVACVSICLEFGGTMGDQCVVLAVASYASRATAGRDFDSLWSSASPDRSDHLAGALVEKGTSGELEIECSSQQRGPPGVGNSPAGWRPHCGSRPGGAVLLGVGIVFQRRVGRGGRRCGSLLESHPSRQASQHEQSSRGGPSGPRCWLPYLTIAMR